MARATRFGFESTCGRTRMPKKKKNQGRDGRRYSDKAISPAEHSGWTGDSRRSMKSCRRRYPEVHGKKVTGSPLIWPPPPPKAMEIKLRIYSSKPRVPPHSRTLYQPFAANMFTIEGQRSRFVRDEHASSIALSTKNPFAIFGYLGPYR